MARNVQHSLLPALSHDDRARQSYVVDFKLALNRRMRATNREIYEQAVKPMLPESADPAQRRDIGRAMYAHPAYRQWCALARAAQEQMWRSVSEPLERDRERLQREFHKRSLDRAAGGSLDLRADFSPPRSVVARAIHLQPGGYAWDRGGDDVTAGALYETGGNLYAFGQGISRSDSKAAHVQRFLGERYPDFRPKRILDLGCSAGAASVHYALAFPDAQVHAVDVGAGMLRYAHARAEALGARVHFHQADCAATGFEDGYFDLVVSHNLLHEIPDRTRRALFAESRRLLAPGGIALHQDVPLRFENYDEYQKFEYSWDTRNNNEPYWEVYATADVEHDMLAAGFDRSQLHVGQLSAASGSLPWFVAVARLPQVAQ
ncbi:MAG: class I SAM-dependent methyltransferase [Steroidobacteraceae bacterium]